ncbi:MAG: serine/threonine protein kinase, partial [Candidatus Abyssubacteria bacterium]|nr:serine/threonine protein kinase [Candidatus Abyssubacteria bacterium]
MVIPESIRLGLKEIVNNASAVHLSESAKGIIEGKPSLIGRFSKEQYYDRYVSWLVQLRYSKHGSFRHVEAPPQERTASPRIRIKVPDDVFKLTTPDAPAKREDQAPISSHEKASRPEEKDERSMPATAATAADTKTIGRYRILGEIGEGGMGVVYKAEQISLGRLVAMKVLPRRLAGDSSFVRRFLNEARAMAAVNHPNIVLIYDVGQEGETNYYTMELVDGVSLEDILLQQSVLSSNRAVNVVAMILNALGHMHQCGIVHRDIKPSNIMIDRSGTAKLMDFGLALQEKSERLTRAGGIVGTPEYMSPEQAAGGTATALSDIYSLGVVFYELLTGNVPFEADTPLGVIHKIREEEPASPRSINPRIPAGLQRIVLKMMAKDPKDRYQNCRAILADLRRFRAGELIRPLRPSFFSSDFSLKKAIAALLLISLIAAVGVHLYRTRKGPLPEERKEILGLQIVELQKSMALLEDQLHTLRVESEINEVRLQIHETKDLIRTLEYQFLQSARGHVSAGAERKKPILAICVAAGYVGLLLALLLLGIDLRPTKRILIAFAVLLSLGILDWYNVLNPCESPFFGECLDYAYAHRPSVVPGLYPPLLFEEACMKPHQQVVNHFSWICRPNTWSLAFLVPQPGKTHCTASCHVSVVSWYYTAIHW